ncbi:hypothetical protein NQ314_019830 [Rhamnusium bicolor]|uniref:DDE Tnp4 domain-containing protein n=1 Tax=Rhamnusium bicolor TaxID=1586634 RepID=A0AAV8WMF1_9CUCU|nr:hypothetical protein NQ314_019830 [Rhamnusium bicolor]
MNRLLIPIMYSAYNMFFEDDSDNEYSENEMFFAEEVIPRMRSHQFKLHFRMDPETFDDLLSKLHEVYIPKVKGQPEICFEKSALLTVWYLANIESFRRYGFPGIIGSIDRTHIKITAPKDSHVSYINRKGYHSVLLQGVCDHNKLFIDVYAGEAGSIHDYTLFLRSDLSRRPDENFYNDTHLIGDLAYKLTTKLIDDFKNFGLLTDRQKVFNKVLAKTRAVIENAFALLKGRFRRLKFIETIRPDLLCLLIMSACILHNLCILHRDSAEDIVRIEEQVAME